MEYEVGYPVSGQAGKGYPVFFVEWLNIAGDQCRVHIIIIN